MDMKPDIIIQGKGIIASRLYLKTNCSRKKGCGSARKKNEVSEQFGILAYITRNFVTDAGHMALLRLCTPTR
jgi:hypothetical protein